MQRTWSENTVGGAVARLRYELAAEAFVAALEAKAGYDPNQPRVPAGYREGGRWTRQRLNRFLDHADEVWADIERVAGRTSFAALRFMRRNRAAINRTLGAVQAIGGGLEMVGGVGLVGGGVATSEIGVGVAVAGAGSFLVVNGYDNWTTGWNAFVTGELQPTRLNRALQQMGLSPEQAAAAEIGFAGGAAAAAGLSGRALEKAARAGLQREALERFAVEPLQVRYNGQSLWLEQDIAKRGAAWEAFDAERTGFKRTHPSFPVFDQIDSTGRTAISNKTVDLVSMSYRREPPGQLLRTLKGYVDQVADFGKGRSGSRRSLAAGLTERRLHVLLTHRGMLPAQTAQINVVKQHAADRGVVITVEYAE